MTHWMNYLWEQDHPSTIEAIDQVENSLGIKFPQQYKDIVIVHQGQVPEHGLFDFEENGEFTTTSMGVLFHFEENEEKYYSYNLLENYHQKKHLLLPFIIPFSEDGGGNQIAFDYRSSKESPSIVFVNHEMLGDQAGLSKIAESFSEFLQKLYEDTDH